MKIYLLNLASLLDYNVMKISIWLANIYTSLNQRLIAIEKSVSESLTRDHVSMAAFPDLIVQYQYPFQY
jgi:hypothetical protein